MNRWLSFTLQRNTHISLVSTTQTTMKLLYILHFDSLRFCSYLFAGKVRSLVQMPCNTNIFTLLNLLFIWTNPLNHYYSKSKIEGKQVQKIWFLVSHSNSFEKHDLYQLMKKYTTDLIIITKEQYIIDAFGIDLCSAQSQTSSVVVFHNLAVLHFNYLISLIDFL